MNKTVPTPKSTKKDVLFLTLFGDCIITVLILLITVEIYKSSFKLITVLQFIFLIISLVIVHSWQWKEKRWYVISQVVFPIIVLCAILTRNGLVAPISLAIAQVGVPLIYSREELTKWQYIEIALIVGVAVFLQYIVFIGGYW